MIEIIYLSNILPKPSTSSVDETQLSAFTFLFIIPYNWPYWNIYRDIEIIFRIIKIWYKKLNW